MAGLAIGEAGDAPPGAPCEEDPVTGECVPVPASEGLLFVGRMLLVAGLVMGLVALARAVRGRPPVEPAQA